VLLSQQSNTERKEYARKIPGSCRMEFREFGFSWIFDFQGFLITLVSVNSSVQEENPGILSTDIQDYLAFSVNL
jgi:hypothetical protein